LNLLMFFTFGRLNRAAQSFFHFSLKFFLIKPIFVVVLIGLLFIISFTLWTGDLVSRPFAFTRFHPSEKKLKVFIKIDDNSIAHLSLASCELRFSPDRAVFACGAALFFFRVWSRVFCPAKSAFLEKNTRNHTRRKLDNWLESLSTVDFLQKPTGSLVASHAGNTGSNPVGITS
jgi:hypothetical protein